VGVRAAMKIERVIEAILIPLTISVFSGLIVVVLMEFKNSWLIFLGGAEITMFVFLLAEYRRLQRIAQQSTKVPTEVDVTNGTYRAGVVNWHVNDDGIPITSIFDDRRAASSNDSIKWMGILGQPTFRTMLADPNRQNKVWAALRSPNLRAEFLFVNPNAESFALRMRHEGKSAKAVEVVKEQVIAEVKRLAELSSQTEERDRIVVKVHSEPLLWSMIIDRDEAYVGHYVLGKTGSDGEVLVIRNLPADAGLFSAFRTYFDQVFERAVRITSTDDLEKTLEQIHIQKTPERAR
jgi:hypothetical protein